jgi:hypothetical protein
MREIRISRRWDATLFDPFTPKLKLRSWLQQICYFLSETCKYNTNLQIGNFYGIQNQKLQITCIVQITQIVRGKDNLPIEAKSVDGTLLWYPEDWLTPCDTDQYNLIAPLVEEDILPHLTIAQKPIQNVKTKDIYKCRIQSYCPSKRAIQNAEKFGWDLKMMFRTLKKLQIPTKIKNTWFQILHNSIQVMTNIHYVDHNPECPLCKTEEEDIEHLLNKCPITRFLQIGNWNTWPTNKYELARHLTTHYFIWKTRCELVFTPNQIIDQIEKQNQLQSLQKQTSFILDKMIETQKIKSFI